MWQIVLLLDCRCGSGRAAALTRSPSVPAWLAQRARIVLLAGEGVSNTAIAEQKHPGISGHFGHPAAVHTPAAPIEVCE
ncbi:hypothetical protein E1262_08195 [Jiangella aurantiaca]|uniref:Uncharacterized protein n=1 Tax=Jiangella aurantiaca TaxID=2530373 RepID=A0A4R5AI52_9ACTN|nr:hypothetical protein E1262_08195 [Jiangella aurantiaca]